LNNSPKVLGVVRDSGGCGHYRIKQPWTKVVKNGLANVQLAGNGIDRVNLADALTEADIIHMPRAGEQYVLDMMDKLKPLGRKFIIDHDDDIFNVNPFSEHYCTSGTKEVFVDVEGKNVPLWEHGKKYLMGTFDIEANQKWLEISKECMRRADAVTVTTDRLASVFSEYNDNIHVLPNCIDFNVWKPQRTNEDEIRIMWSGGCSHYKDLLTISEPLTYILQKYNNVKFIMCGQEFSGLTKNIPKDRYEFHEWVPVAAHPYKQMLLNADIAIAPVTDDVFNASKSPVKYFESASLGIPVLASNRPPYSDVIDNWNNGILFGDEDDFEESLDRLIVDKNLRERIGRAGMNHIKDNYCADKNAYMWANLVLSVTENKLVTLDG